MWSNAYYQVHWKNHGDAFICYELDSLDLYKAKEQHLKCFKDIAINSHELFIIMLHSLGLSYDLKELWNHVFMKSHDFFILWPWKNMVLKKHILFSKPWKWSNLRSSRMQVKRDGGKRGEGRLMRGGQQDDSEKKKTKKATIALDGQTIFFHCRPPITSIHCTIILY